MALLPLNVGPSRGIPRVPRQDPDQETATKALYDHAGRLIRELEVQGDGREHRRRIAMEVNRHDERLEALDDATDGALLLGGRDGGQVAHGGTATGEALELHSNTAEDGKLNLGDTLYVNEANDRVGIGTDTPSGPLHVQAAGDVVAYLVSTGTGRAQIFFNDANRSYLFGKDPSDNFSLTDVTSGTAPFRVLPGSLTNALRLEPAGASFVAGSGSFGGATGALFIGNGTVAPSSNPVDGVILQSRDVTAGQANLYARNENGSDERLTGLTSRMSAQQNFTTTTLAGIGALGLPLEAGKAYAFEFHLFYDASAFGGHKYGTVAVNGLTATSITYHIRATSDASNAMVITSRQTAIGGSSGQTGSVGGIAIIEGLIVVGVGGVLRPSFAQNSGPSGTSSLLAGSWGRLVPIGQ